MAWEHLSVDKPHVAYTLLGGFITVFSLISLFIKEKLYIGEATVASVFGVIIGPHALDWFDPETWGNTDRITIELSRIVLVVQIFAVAVELPKKYMLKHWLSVTMLLGPVMIFGWLITSVIVWKLVPSIRWIEGLAIAACVTATDPVLASAIVGKGSFAMKHVPGHLRNLLSAESGVNDGLSVPFAYFAIFCIRYEGKSGQIAYHFLAIAVLYEIIAATVMGAIVGWGFRHMITFCERQKLIDRESFLSFYFVLAIFCGGFGTLIGVDEFVLTFAAGSAFSWNDRYRTETEKSHVSNVIDLLLNMAYFVYFGSIVPWEQFNNLEIGLSAWKLVVMAILVLIFRRIPAVLAIKPFTPDIKTFREALFSGYFGPMGVGAIYIALLIRAEFETGHNTPLKELPPKDSENYMAIATIWPVTCFLVVASILVHGSSIAVFTLGKRLNNMTITMTYTTNGNNQSWLQRLPRIEGGKTLSLHKVDTEEPSRFKIGQSAKPSGGMRKRKSGRGDHRPESTALDLNAPRKSGEVDQSSEEDEQLQQNQAYKEGDHLVVEDPHGEVITTIDHPEANSSGASSNNEKGKEKEHYPKKSHASKSGSSSPGDRHHKVTAYQFDDTIIVENEEGEVIRRYKINRREDDNSAPASSGGNEPMRNFMQGFDKSLQFFGLKRAESNLGQSSNSPNASSPAVQHTASPDVESNAATGPGHEDELVRIDGKEHKLTVDEETMKNQLKEMMLNQPSNNNDKPDPTADKEDKLPTNFLRERDDDEDSLDNVDVDDAEETEVEKKRRLAALGLQGNDEEDSDDEEVISRSAYVMPPAIREEDEEDHDERGQPPQSRQQVKWGSDVK